MDKILPIEQMHGYNTIIGGDGDDVITVSGDHNTVDMGKGNDDLTFFGSHNDIDAGDGDDVIVTDASILPEGMARTQTAHSQETEVLNSSTSSQSGDWMTTTNMQTTNVYDHTVVSELGSNNNNIKAGNGNDVIKLVGAQNTVDGGKGNDLIDIRAPKVLSDTRELNSSESSTLVTGTSRTYVDPLVLDLDKDGEVEAQAGMGIDIDGDGKADGAAVGGDKMLAMSDLNGNGIIDGAEVFGDRTINPFTGQAMNSANGFEALKNIALSAENQTGLDVYNNGNVDINLLSQAMQMANVGSLGFVSDNNNEEIEDLEGVSSVNVDDYDEVQDTGDVQHNQQGTYIDENGNVQKADDVWFNI